MTDKGKKRKLVLNEDDHDGSSESVSKKAPAPLASPQQQDSVTTAAPTTDSKSSNNLNSNFSIAASDFVKLPNDIQNAVANYLNVADIGSMSRVSKEMNAIAYRDEIWSKHLKFLFEKYYDKSLMTTEDRQHSSSSSSGESDGVEKDSSTSSPPVPVIRPLPLSQRPLQPAHLVEWLREWQILYAKKLGLWPLHSIASIENWQDYVDMDSSSDMKDDDEEKKKKASSLTDEQKEQIVKKLNKKHKFYSFMSRFPDCVLDLDAFNEPFLYTDDFRFLVSTDTNTNTTTSIADIDIEEQQRRFNWLFMDEHVPIREYYRRAGEIIRLGRKEMFSHSEESAEDRNRCVDCWAKRFRCNGDCSYDYEREFLRNSGSDSEGGFYSGYECDCPPCECEPGDEIIKHVECMPKIRNFKFRY